MTDAAAKADDLTNAVKSDDTSAKPLSRNARIFNVVIGIAFLGMAPWMFIEGLDRYRAALHFSATATTYTQTIPSNISFLIPFGLLAAAGLFAALLNFTGGRGLTVESLFISAVIAAMIVFVASLMLMSITEQQVRGNTPTIDTWMQTTYHVQNYDLPSINQDFSVLDTDGTKQTFSYKENGPTVTITHLGNATSN